MTHRKLNVSNGVSTSQLKIIYAIRTLGEERKLGQYKLVEGGQIKYFNTFKELKYYSDIVLYTKHKHIVIAKGELPEDSHDLC